MAHTDKKDDSVGGTVDPLDWKSHDSIQKGSSEARILAVMLFAARGDYMTWCVENKMKN